MTRLTSCLLLLSLLATVSSLSAQATDPLAAMRTAWQQALEQQDLEASIALFTPDALFLTPDGGRYDDRAAIRTLYRSVFAAYRSHIAMTSKHEECAPRLCVDEGTYSETMTETATSKQIPVAGSYILVARRSPDNTWKIAEMVWTGGPH